MGLKLKKSVSLGKGIRLNVGEKGVSISGGIKGLRIGVGPRGIRTTAKIPGTDISYTQSHSFKNLKKLFDNKESSKSAVKVIEGSQLTKILANEAPKELRSQFYMLQSFVGTLGILCIFASFIEPLLLFVGSLLIAGKLFWRKRTDATVVHYKNISKFFHSKAYEKCIDAIDHVLQHPQGDPRLNLIKAECYLNLRDLTNASETYRSFFQVHLSLLDSAPEYWSPRVNGILLILEKQDYTLALKIAETLENSSFNETENRLWKGYIKGLCFMEMEEYEAAILAFQDAVGRKRSMEEPYIDAHYQMGIAYSRTGKNSLAKKRFTRVYSANTSYKKIAEIMKNINSEPI